MKNQTINQMIANSQRIIPVQYPNRADQITKNADGSMSVKQKSGEVFEIGEDAFEAQLFVIFTMLNSETTESQFEHERKAAAHG
jgi:hypothetical protein